MKALNALMIFILVFFTLFLGAKAVQWELDKDKMQGEFILHG